MDYYELLAVRRGATPEEIRTAYREWVQLIHPDRNRGNARAEELAKRINEAYAVLSDPMRRREYDRNNLRDAEVRAPHRNQRERDGGDDTGQIVVASDLGTVLTGFNFDEDCPCRSNVPIEVITGTIHGGFPPGFHDGDVDKAQCFLCETIFDCVVRVEPHHIFERRGNDLQMQIWVNEDDVTRNSAIPIQVLDRKARGPNMLDEPITKEIKVTLPPQIKDGQRVRIVGYGLPHLNNPAQRGDLLVNVNVQPARRVDFVIDQPT